MILSFVVGVALGYMVFHIRYADTRSIDEMRSVISSSQHKIDEFTQTKRELETQNTLLKNKTEQLLDQNEDYSKMISKLSRYYFHIKEANIKIDELKKVLQMFDDGLEHQLGQGGGIADLELLHTDGLKDLTPSSKNISDQKFF